MRPTFKPVLLAVCAFFLLDSCSKEIPQIDSESGIHFYINSGEEFITKVIKLSDGLAYIGKSGSDAFVLKVNEEGKQVWKQYVDFGATEIFWDATATYDGGIVAVGQSNPYGDFNNTIMTKINANGQEEWGYWFPDSIYGSGMFAVAEDKDHNLWMGGYFYPSGTYYLLYKFDKDANYIFSRYYSGDYLNFIKSIDFNAAGDVVLGALSSMSPFVIEIRKYQVNTVVLSADSGYVLDYHKYTSFTRAVNVNINNNHLSLFAKPDGYAHFATWQRQQDSLNTILFVDADLAGNVRRSRTFNGLGSARFINARRLEDGSYIVTGETSEGKFNYTKALVMKVSENGVVQWESFIGGEEKRMQAYNAFYSNGRWLVGGAVKDHNLGFSRLMYYHLDDLGNLITE